MSRRICRSIGRRTLINKGYSKEIAIIYTLRAWAAIACRSVTTYRPYAIHTCSWRCHVTRAFSFHANTRCTCLVRSAFEESIDRGYPPPPLCLSSSSLPPQTIAGLAASFAMRSKHRSNGRGRFRLTLAALCTQMRVWRKLSVWTKDTYQPRVVGNCGTSVKGVILGEKRSGK